MLQESVLKKGRDYFSANPAVWLAYLFGSQARGAAGAFSDIDIAVLFSASPSLDEHATMQVDLCRLLGTDAVDLVVLNDASPLLKLDAVTEGKLLYQAVSNDRMNDFEMGVIREYFDTEPLRAVQEMYLKEQFLGSSHGA